MFRRFAVGASVFLLIGCAIANFHPIKPEERASDFPEVGKIATREVGETIIEQADLKYHDYAVFSEPLTLPAALSKAIKLRADTPYVARTTYEETGQQVYCGPGQACDSFGNCNYELDGKRLFACFTKRGDEIAAITNKEQDYIKAPMGLKYGKIPVEEKAGFQRHLLYTGKSGTVIYLTYREYIDDLVRPAFTQQLTFDLSASSVIGFKGARIEILDATNTSIRYRLLKPFPDRDNESESMLLQ